MTEISVLLRGSGLRLACKGPVKVVRAKKSGEVFRISSARSRPHEAG